MGNYIEGLVSVIIPCYNSELFIRECVDSVLKQSYFNYEIIIIDDGSVDNSLNIISSFGDSVRVYSQENKGACHARNKGLSVAKGEFVKFLDSDDYLFEDVLLTQVELIKKLPQNHIVYGDYSLLLNNKCKYVSNNDVSYDTLNRLVNFDVLTTPPLHRAKLLREVNGFDERFKHGQEWNLHIRLAALGVVFHYNRHNTFYYRQHASDTRISLNRKFDCQYEVLKREMTLSDIKCSQIFNEFTYSAFSYSYIKIGRKSLMLGDSKLAVYCFDYANSLSLKPLYYAGHIYNFLSLFFSVLYIEKAYCFVFKRLRL